MTIQIRKSVFETNSSSSHSLTLSKGDLVKAPFSLQDLRGGCVRIKVGEFGWEYFRYYTAHGKMCYLLTQITRGNLPAGSPEKITTQLCQEDERIDMMRAVVLEHTGCRLLIESSSGYIDHDSEGVGTELFNNKTTLRDFLFNDKCFVETSNDNVDAPWQISTDKGSDYYYADSIKKVPKSYLPLTLKVDYGDFTTESSALITKYTYPKLHESLLKFGIASHIEQLLEASYNSGDLVKHDVRQGAAYLVANGLKMAQTLTAHNSFKLVEKSYNTVYTATIYVPAKLAREINALKKTPKVLVDLNAATNEREMASRFLTETTPPDSEDLKRFEKAKEKVGKLRAKAIEKGLL